LEKVTESKWEYAILAFIGGYSPSRKYAADISNVKVFLGII